VGEVPAFTGPWASDFDRAYRAATSELQRRVLADGKITAAEDKAVEDAFADCMSQAGYPGVTFEGNGAFSFPLPDGPDQSHGVVERCQQGALGDVDFLYWQTQQRPNNEPVAPAIAECLVRMKLVPAGYTADQYLRDSASGKPPFDVDSPDFGKCMTDPLNAGR